MFLHNVECDIPCRIKSLNYWYEIFVKVIKFGKSLEKLVISVSLL